MRPSTRLLTRKFWPRDFLAGTGRLGFGTRRAGAKGARSVSVDSATMCLTTSANEGRAFPYRSGKQAVHLRSISSETYRKEAAQARLPYGTRNTLLTAASFRT